VYVSDSTTIEKNGDSTTVTKSKSRDTYRGKTRIDTVKVTKYVKEPYRVEVEKKLSKYEEISLKVGMWLIPILAILVVIAICRFVYKRK
jgi:cobalamin biosynthesis Mg chelatase CobN